MSVMKGLINTSFKNFAQQLSDVCANKEYIILPSGTMPRVEVVGSHTNGEPPVLVTHMLNERTDEMERLLERSGISLSDVQIDHLEVCAQRLVIESPATLDDARRALVALLPREHVNPVVGTICRNMPPAYFSHIFEHAKDRLCRGLTVNPRVSPVWNFETTDNVVNDEDVEVENSDVSVDAPAEHRYHNTYMDEYRQNLRDELELNPLLQGLQLAPDGSGTVTIDGVEYDLVPKKKKDKPIKPQGRRIRL